MWRIFAILLYSTVSAQAGSGSGRTHLPLEPASLPSHLQGDVQKEKDLVEEKAKKALKTINYELGE